MASEETAPPSSPLDLSPKLAMGKRYVTSVSFDLGLMEMDEERVKVAAAQFFRNRFAARSGGFEVNKGGVKEEEKKKKKKAVTEEENIEEKEESRNDGVEPDWSAFESAFASELFPKDDGYAKSVQFLTEVVDLLIDYVRKMNDRSTKVLDFHHPHQLKEALGHCLDIPETPRDLEQILSDCKETLKYGVKTGHPRFFNQLSSGLDVIALAGEWLTATANTNMFTYEIAPVFTLMEEVTLQRMREFVGWEDGDGIFAPGGAISNLYAVMAARYKRFPELKMNGMAGGPKLALFTSEHAHYSIKQAAAVTGIGVNNVFLIQTDERGKMLITDLVRKIEEARARGLEPLMISATAGTTVLGAFDPLEEITEVCREHGLWMHVDAAWGGGVLISKRHNFLVKGIANADSVTWNPHKVMGVTLQCSVVLLKDKNLLTDCNSMNATYLFQQDKQYDMGYDTGDKAIQCGRHNDVFKLWLMWRAKGDEGFEKQINLLFELSRYLQDQLLKREGFEFVMDRPEYLNVCFWYVPKKLRGIKDQKKRNDQINQVAPKIKAMMMEAGTTMVGYQPLGHFPNFFRMVVSNPAAKPGDIDFLLDEIARFGEEI